MRGLAIGAALISIVALAGFAVYKFVLPLRPPARDIRQSLPQNDQTNGPFRLPAGFRLDVFADLAGAAPRALAFSPNGVLHASIPGKGKVVALPDTNRDGVADTVVEVVTGLDKPHGIAFDNGYLYVAQTNQVVRYVYNPGSMTATSPEVLFALPGGGTHYTRTIKIANGKLYTSIGSSCNVCVEENAKRATIWVSDLDGRNLRLFTKGLRNTVFFTFAPDGTMWGADMGRDNLGDSLPPDEINILTDGKDYGWPYCYGKQIRDGKFEGGTKGAYCAGTEPSAFDLPAHVAPLGMAFTPHGDLLVAEHGSWNSSVPVGYKVVKLSIFAGQVTGMTDYISGWLAGKEVLGRPVDLLYDADGRLFISDDKANVIYALTQQ